MHMRLVEFLNQMQGERVEGCSEAQKKELQIFLYLLVISSEQIKYANPL